MTAQRTLQEAGCEIDTNIAIPGSSAVFLDIGENVLSLKFFYSSQNTIFGAEPNDDPRYPYEERLSPEF